MNGLKDDGARARKSMFDLFVFLVDANSFHPFHHLTDRVGYRSRQTKAVVCQSNVEDRFLPFKVRKYLSLFHLG